jgi:hypothetical protein
MSRPKLSGSDWSIFRKGRAGTYQKVGTVVDPPMIEYSISGHAVQETVQTELGPIVMFIPIITVDARVLRRAFSDLTPKPSQGGSGEAEAPG